MITKFKDLHYGSVGIVFWYEDKVLLVNPYDPDDVFDGWSYPKGHSEKGESHKETALREVSEEIKISLPKNFLDETELEELKPLLKDRGIKHYWYFTYNLSPEDFNTYFNNLLIIPKENLQLDEVEEARFMDRNEAKKLISSRFAGIL